MKNNKTKRITLCTLKVLGKTLLGIFIFLYLLIAILNSTIVQSFLAAKVSDYFSKEWKAKVSIGGLEIRPLLTVGLKDVYLKNPQKDTIATVGYLEASLKNFEFIKGLEFSYVRLDDVNYDLTIENHKLNLSFIIDYFKSDKPKEEKEKAPYVIKVDRCKLNNVNFSLNLNDSPSPIPEFGVAVNHMQYQQINGVFDDIIVINDSINVNIKRFSAKERSGVTLKNLKGKFIVSPKGIICRSMRVETEESDLRLYASIKTDSWKTYSYFIDSADCFLFLQRGSKVGMKDATYWAPMLKGFDQKCEIGAIIKGTVADAKCSFLEIKTGDTYIKGKGSVKGLPNIEETVFDVELSELKSSSQDFNQIQFGEMLSDVKLPELLNSLGEISMTADFKGLLHNFEANAKISTAIGVVDLTGKSTRENPQDNITYQAKINSNQFNIGKFLGVEILGDGALNVDAKAKVGELKNMECNLLANLQNFNINGNRYNSIEIEGEMSEGIVNAQCDIFDQAAIINLNCEMDLLNNFSTILRGDLNEVNLQKMNFFNFPDTTAVISTDIVARANGFNLDSLRAFIDFRNAIISTQSKNYDIDYLNIRTRNDSIANILTLNSNIFSLVAEGKYTIESLVEYINGFVATYIPDFSLLSPKPTQTHSTQTNIIPFNTNNNINLKVELKNLDMITDLFALNMNVAPQTLLTANINPQQDLILDLKSDYFIYDTYIFQNISLNSNANNGLFDNHLKVSNIKLGDSLNISANDLNISHNNGEILLNLQAGMSEKDELSAVLDFKGFITPNGLQGYFNNSYINIAKSTVKLNDNHTISYFDNALSLLNFSLKQNKGSITLNGNISDKPNNKLDVNFKDLDISTFNPILNSFGLNLKGQINQKVVLRNILSNFNLTSNLVIDDLFVNGINLGKASFNINNALTKEVFATNIKMQYKSQDKKAIVPLSIKGFINTKSKDNNLDLKLSMDNLNLKIIEPYLASLSSDIGGTLYTKDLKIKGPFTQPNISGVLETKNAHLKIDILNITYDFNDKIYLNDNIFSLNNFILLDKQKNKIILNGDITHYNFTDFKLNINAVADKLKILDTDEYSDQMYYGTAFASATADVRGDLNHLDIDVAARTERGTVLTVPVSSKTSATQNSFIKFVTIQDTTNVSLEEKIKQEETQGLTYDISVDLNVTPDAQLILPMDFNQLKGDLSAKGNGDLKIILDSQGELSLIGGIEIDNGQFKMSVMDMMAKTFEIEQGGTLTWTGEPAGGNLDVQAVYKTKASLMPILGSEYSKAVDVHSIIKLTGSMMNPQPKFDIRLPNTDDNTVERLFMNIDRNDEKAMLEQTVSLLFLHQFYSAEGNYENTVMETGISSAFEAAFGQISGMLTDVIKVVDVNMNYSRGTETTSDQFDLNLSRDYGRLVVNVNSSFGTGDNVSTATQETNAIIGDAYVEYKMTDAFRVRVFNRSNANDFTKYNISPFTQGIGLFYRKQFDSFNEIFHRKKKEKS